MSLLRLRKKRVLALQKVEQLISLNALELEAPNLFRKPEEYINHEVIQLSNLAKCIVACNEARKKITETAMFVSQSETLNNFTNLSMIEIIGQMRRHRKILQQKQEQILHMEEDIRNIQNLASKQANEIFELEQKLGTHRGGRPRYQQIIISTNKRNIDESLIKYKLTQELIGHTDCVWDIATSPDGNFIVASGHDFSVRSWRYNGTKWENLHNYNTHTNFVKSVDCRLVNGRLLVASASHDATVKCWDALNGNCIWSQGHSSSVLGVAIGDNLVVSAGFNDKSYRVWQLENGTHVKTISNAFNHTAVYVKFRDPVTCREIVTGGNDDTSVGMMKMFDVETGSLTLTSKGNHPGWIWRVAVSDDAKFVITSSYVHNLIKVWDLNSGELVRSLDGHTGGVYQLNTCCYHYLVSAGEDKNVNVWNWETGNRINSFPAKSSAFRGACCSPDGRWITGGGGDQAVFLWSL